MENSRSLRAARKRVARQLSCCLILFAVTLLAAKAVPAWAAPAVVCAPAPNQWFQGKGPVITHEKRVLLVTHASREFNADATTIAGIQNTINILTPTSEVLYLHRGGFKNYMYPSCNPEWFYKSEGGEIKLDLDATDTVVLVGGYYNYCLGDTFIGVSKAIRGLTPPHDIRLVYVIDGDFEAFDALQTAGGLMHEQNQDLMAHVGLTFNYAYMAQVLASGFGSPEDFETMLASVYASQPFPEQYDVTGHFLNRYWKGVKQDWVDWSVQSVPKGPKIDVYYLESKDLKGFFGI